MTRHTGTVVAFEREAGLGTVRRDTDGVTFEFHCVEIADGTRDIDVGAAVSFVVLPKLGRFEAGAVERR